MDRSQYVCTIYVYRFSFGIREVSEGCQVVVGQFWVRRCLEAVDEDQEGTRLDQTLLVTVTSGEYYTEKDVS